MTEDERLLVNRVLLELFNNNKVSKEFLLIDYSLLLKMTKEIDFHTMKKLAEIIFNKVDSSKTGSNTPYGNFLLNLLKIKLEYNYNIPMRYFFPIMNLKEIDNMVELIYKYYENDKNCEIGNLLNFNTKFCRLVLIDKLNWDIVLRMRISKQYISDEMLEIFINSNRLQLLSLLKKGKIPNRWLLDERFQKMLIKDEEISLGKYFFTETNKKLLEDFYNFPDRDYPIINKWCMEIGLTIEELKRKIDYLYKKNDLFFKMIYFPLLSKKYEIIPEKFFLQFILHLNIQSKISSLSDEELYIFSRLLKLVDKNKWNNNYIISFLNNINKYNYLINKSMSDEQLENFAILCSHDNITLKLEDIDDLNDQKFENKELDYSNNLFEEAKKNRDINGILNAIFIKKYGASLNEIININNNFLNILGEEKIDQNILDIVGDIYKILNCTDFGFLIKLYNETTRVKINNKSNYYLYNIIRNSVSKLYNNLYQVSNNQDDRVFIHDESIKDIQFYEPKGDFEFLIHVLSPYGREEISKEYKANWNKPNMSSHCISTSYICQSSIGHATIRDVTFGFDSILEKDVYLSSSDDAYTNGEDFVVDKQVIPPNQLTERTVIYDRNSTYNEVLLERYVENDKTLIKRPPSYVILFTDGTKDSFISKRKLIDILKEKNIPEQIISEINNANELDDIKSLSLLPLDIQTLIRKSIIFENSVTAARDLGIPIIIINKLKIVKREYQKFENIKNAYFYNRNPLLIRDLLSLYRKNLVTCSNTKDGYNDSEYHTYFTMNKLKEHIYELLRFINEEYESGEEQKEVLLFLQNEIRRLFGKSFQTEFNNLMIDNGKTM